MLFTITNAGIAAATQAGIGGPKIEIATFKLGSGSGYTPTVFDNNIHGTVLYTGNVSNYRIDATDIVSYDCIVDQDIGDFSFGEVGLYLAGGTLFALATFDAIQPKRKATPTSPGNSINVQAKLVFTNIAAVIDYEILTLTEAKLIEVPSVNVLQAPLFSPANAYIAHGGDDEGNPILVMRDSNYKWRFMNHKTIVVSGAITSGTNTASQITSTALALGLDNVVAGKYLIQFTSGALQGFPRTVASAASNTLTVSAPFGSAPNVGDTFEVYQSDSSLINTISSLEDDLTALILALSSTNN
jgi:hypothetical protein